MKKVLISIVLILVIFPLFAQTVLLEQNVLADSSKPRFGPNMRHYVNLFAGFGFMLGPSENAGSKIKYGISNHFELGMRYKLKLCNHYALGTDLSYNVYSFSIAQHPGKTLPDAVQHKKESLTNHTLELSIFQRINIGRRGNYMGNFVDMGAYGSYAFAAVNATKDKLQGGQILRTRISRLTYPEEYGYGLLLRFGMNRYVLYAKYRMTDLFEKTCSYADLPKLTAGVQIGFHK